ncbi:sulfonate ABC transporter substrate-binding protein [Brevibacillus thermoruber]|uniref:sulfonate ABC transporter substrate-binding protein n=1 Tax=Brevibacillus thermoruber TaxID=33942 RepID=UPI000424FA5B|nr:sulfonate ABC transporter substrate-binding protein [Brevibacillus thermoruber]
MKNVIAALLTTICLLAALTACGSQTPKETAATSAAEGQRVIRIGFQKYGTMNVLKAQGWLEKRLADAGVKVEWTEFPGGPQLLEALNVGSIEIGHTGEAPPIFAQAAGAPLVYLAHEPPSPQGEGILVPNGSPVKTVADLKGKKVALNKGSNVHYLLVKQLEAAGLQYKDVKTAFLPPADARAAFEQGSVDAWVVWDPFLAAAQTATNATLLADGRGVVSNHEFYLASRTFAENHPDIIDALLDELNKVDEWAKNNQDELAELLSAQLGIDVPSLKLAAGRREYGVRPITDEVIAEQQRIADTFAKLGLIPQPIHVKDAVWKK